MKKPVKVILWIIAIVILLPILFYIIGSAGSGSDSAATTASEATEDPSQERKPKSSWKYESQINEMDDSATYHARVKADETLEFDFPYNGGTDVYIALWHQSGKNIATLRISKGQFMGSLLDGKITVRFDSSPAQTYHYSDPTDGSTEIIFIDDADKFIENLKSAKRTTVQCTFFNEGTRTIHFNTDQLEWEH
ncbi:MAG: hypothetical protein LBR57_03350 [Alistipes sp.]|jgi:ABC-type glycerol-3-phosphate transport system permease component|nr:hypothetical protein [Alistipes sp.]